MSDREISYDIRLAEKLDSLKKQMWFKEELQIHSDDQRKIIFKMYQKLFEHSC